MVVPSNEVDSIQEAIQEAIDDYQNARDRMADGTRITIESLLDQCYAMLKLRNSCGDFLGGTLFCQTVRERLSIDYSWARNLMRIARHPYFSNATENLAVKTGSYDFIPPNFTAIIILLPLSSQQIEECIVAKKITNSLKNRELRVLAREVRGLPVKPTSTKKAVSSIAIDDAVVDDAAIDWNSLGDLVAPEMEAIAVDFMHDDCLYAQSLLEIQNNFINDLSSLPFSEQNNLSTIIRKLAAFNQKLFQRQMAHTTPKYNKALESKLKKELAKQKIYTEKLIAGEVAISEFDIRGMNKKDAKIIQSALHPDKGGNTKAFQIFRSYTKK